MKQRASTQLTYFYKFVFPGMLALPFGIAAVVSLIRREWMALPFAVVALYCGSIYVWFSPRYMAVEFDDEFLYVSNASREIQIPWTQIDHIHRLVMCQWPTYAISFRMATDFGRKIFFSIPFRLPFGYDTDVVQRMRDRVCKRKGA